jgi:hypothetical protein
MNQRIRLALPVVGIALCMVLLYMWNTGAFGKKPGSAGHESAATSDHGAASTAGSPASDSATTGASSSNGASSNVDTASGELATSQLRMKKLPDSDELALIGLPPQQQAEQMMMAAVNHFDGVTNLVKQRVGGWRGQIKKTPNWDTVELEARYSSDMRVRDAAIEVDLTMAQFDKNSDTVEHLISDAQANAANRGYDLTMLGMLANRNVERDRVHTALKDWAHDPDEATRYWAIEGLAYIGSDDTISDFLEVLRSDASLRVRERCGASLAKSGMLTREQRMKAVPSLIDIAADSSQDATTRGWAFQALREITAHTMADDAGAWQAWFSAHGTERLDEFRRGDPNAVLGNS